MSNVFHLVPTKISDETLRKVARVHAKILDGDVIGVVIVAEHRGGHFTADIAGESRRAIDRTRGRLLAVDDALAKLDPAPK